LKEICARGRGFRVPAEGLPWGFGSGSLPFFVKEVYTPNKPQFGEFQYFRLHGITGYAYQYTEGDLRALKKWADQKQTYLLFNNNTMNLNPE
jgi:uncharacterized protein YecE (DUF72 family)